MEHFFAGFYKRANAISDVKKGVSAISKRLRKPAAAIAEKKTVPVAHTIQYSGSYSNKQPKVLDAAGRDLSAPKPVPPPPPKSIHEQAAEKLKVRAQGMHSYSDIEKELQKGKN